MLPRKTFVLGNSCSGKSTLVAEIRKQDSGIIAFDDYSVLREFFELDNRIRTSTHDSLVKNLRDLQQNTSFLSEKIESIINEIKHKELKHTSYKFQSFRNADGSHNILDLDLWHEVLERLFAKATSAHANYIFEFARGDSESYLKHFGIGPGESYSYHLSRLISSDVDFSSAGIVYIKSDLESRINRSIRRKANGGHYLSPEIMTAVYKSDSFLNQIKHKGDLAYLCIQGLGIPVFIADNSEDISEEFITNKLGRIVQDMNEYFSMHLTHFL